MFRESILCFIAVMFCTSIAFAGTLFTVDDVQVDVTAENAITARDQAFEEAQMQAFKTLSERMLDEDAVKTYKTPDLDTISTLIKDYEITGEKLSAVRYIATYTIRFRESAVRRLFSTSGQNYTDVQSKPLLVLPFYQKGAATILWGQGNLWMQAWARSKNKGGLVPLTVPLGDIQDVKDIADHQSMNYDHQNLENILKRYHAGEAVMLTATPDEHLSLIDDPTQLSTGSMQINIFRTDRNGPEYVDQLTIMAQPDQTTAEMMDSAVAQVKAALNKDWKSKTVTAASGLKEFFNIDVPIHSLKDWAEIQSILTSIGGVHDLKIKSLTRKSAKLSLQYTGNAQRLTLALQQRDLILEKIGSDIQSGYFPAGFSQSYILTRQYDTPARNVRQAPQFKRTTLNPNYTQRF